MDKDKIIYIPKCVGDKNHFFLDMVFYYAFCKYLHHHVGKWEWSFEREDKRKAIP